MNNQNQRYRIVQVQITDRCNMKCPYCYIIQKNKDLTIETFVKQFENLYKVEKYYEAVSGYTIAYFGGEPLLNLETIYAIEDYLKERKIPHNSHVQTNSILLTEEIVKKLEEKNVAWGFSFDGLWQKNIMAYDRNGKFRNSFDIFEQDFKEKKFLEFRTPKTMVSPNSIKMYSLLENYRYFYDKLNIKCPDFTLVRDNIWSKEDIELYKKQIDELADYLISETINSKSIKSVSLFELYISDTLCGKMFGKRKFGCFAGYDGVSLSPVGIIYPCTRFYINKKFPLYNSNTDELYANNIEFLKKYTPNKEKEKCKECSLYTFCNCGCTYSQLEYNNFKNTEPVDCICEILKYSYKTAYRYFQAVNKHVDYYQYLKEKYGFFK